MSTVGLEPATTASERPQIHALDRAATRIGESRFTPKGGGIEIFFAGGGTLGERSQWRPWWILKKDLGAIRYKIERFMGIAEIQNPGTGVSGTEFLG